MRFSLLTVSAEEYYANIIKFAKNTQIDWQICNEAGHPIYVSDEYNDTDTLFFVLESEQKYHLNIQASELCNKDSLWLHLEHNGSPIIAVFAEDEVGEYSYPFYTGIKDNVLKIVGGTKVDIADYPWQVYLRSGNYMCGGIIIAKKWILTAAHCTQDDDGNSISSDDMIVVAGTTHPYSASSEHKFYVENYSRHSEYDRASLINDIAVLELYDEIDIENTEAIELISLRDDENGVTSPGVMATITGWGLLRGVENPSDSDFPKDLQMVQLPIVSQKAASSVWRDTNISFIFAGYKNGNKDACGGDSGGPLIVNVDGKKKLAGIVSWGSESCNTYGAFTRVSYFLDWIEDKTGVTPSGEITKPQGDTIICYGTISSEYICLKGDSSTFEWKLNPTEAGTLITDNNKSTITWNQDFFGIATLAVRAKLDGELTAWASIDIRIVKNTNILSELKDTIICQGNYLSLNILAEGHNLTYNWYKNDNLYISDSDSNLVFSEIDTTDTGIYSCVVKGECGECNSKSFSLTVLPRTNVIEINRNNREKNSEDVNLWVKTIGNNLRYQWFKDGQEIPGETNQNLHIVNNNAKNIGNYQVVINGTCESDTSKQEYVYFGYEKSNSESVRIYQTFVDNGFGIAVNTDVPYSLDVISSDGNIVLSKRDLIHNSYISLPELSSGIYFVKISDNMELYSIKRIIVE